MTAPPDKRSPGNLLLYRVEHSGEVGVLIIEDALQDDGRLTCCHHQNAPLAALQHLLQFM